MSKSQEIPSKSALRAHCRSIRQNISAEDYRLECRKIISRTALIPELMEARSILSYWPKIEAREIDVRPLNAWLRARGCAVLLPAIEPNSEVSRMHWGHFDHENTFIMNRWGIPEPARRSNVAANEIDVVLVPGLGFDTRGHRVGYGGGYYDIMFETVDALKIGMCMNLCLLDMIPNQPHDIPVNYLVTSKRTLRLF